MNKTKEMMVAFSNKQRDLAAAVISTNHRKPVGIVEECKYLGTIFDNLLKFASNIEEIIRKCSSGTNFFWGQQGYVLLLLH